MYTFSLLGLAGFNVMSVNVLCGAFRTWDVFYFFFEFTTLQRLASLSTVVIKYRGGSGGGGEKEKWNSFIEHLLCARCCKYFTFILFLLQNNLTTKKNTNKQTKKPSGN